MRGGLATRRGQQAVWWIAVVALAGCGGTDIVARQRVECPAFDAGCEDAGEVEDADVLDASDANDASSDAGGDAEVDAADAAPEASVPASCGARSCAALDSYAALCTGSGNTVQAGDSCAADAGPTSARYALCTCRDLVSTTVFNVDAFRGTLQTPAPDSAPVGVNLDLALSGTGTIDGEVRVVGRRAVGPNMRLDALVPVTTPPCRCDQPALLDIAGLVQAHQNDNDNAREGLSGGELDGFSGDKELTLPCGRYYFTRLQSEDALTIHTRGNVAIFVEDNIELNDAFSIRTDDDAAGQVSLFVAGNAHVRGALALGGDPNGRARVNLYLHGSGTLDLGGSTEIVGQVYAPRAELVNSGILQLWGSLFVWRAALGADTYIHYDANTATPTRCEGP
ncbi:MAG TPA: hypothetical protein VFZ61_04895 [Polyangiales bacterium]